MSVSSDLVNNFCDLQGTALLGGVNALHTSFPDDPEEEYKVQGKLVIQISRCYLFVFFN